MFTDDYLKQFSKDNPLKISKTSVDNMKEYVANNFEKGTSRTSAPDGEITYDEYLVPYLRDGAAQHPNLLLLCPSLDPNGNNCHPNIFLRDWFEEGVSTNLKCVTPDAECRKCNLASRRILLLLHGTDVYLITM